MNDYLRDNYWSRNRVNDQDIDALNIAACRLLLDTMPGLETSAVFQADNESLINRLLKWAHNSVEPLQSYATGLLAAAMDVQEVATKYRDQNGRLIPIMLERLWKLQTSLSPIKAMEPDLEPANSITNIETNIEEGEGDTSLTRPFAHLSGLRVLALGADENEQINQSTPVNELQYSLRNKSKQDFIF